MQITINDKSCLTTHKISVISIWRCIYS